MWFNCRLFSYKMRENAKIVEIYHGVVISENKSIFLGPIQRWVQQSHTKLLGQRRNACFVFVFVVIIFEVDLVGLVFSTRVVIDCGQKKIKLYGGQKLHTRILRLQVIINTTCILFKHAVLKLKLICSSHI